MFGVRSIHILESPRCQCAGGNEEEIGNQRNQLTGEARPGESRAVAVDADLTLRVRGKPPGDRGQDKER